MYTGEDVGNVSCEICPSGNMMNGISSSVLMLFCLSDTVSQQLLVLLKASYQPDCPLHLTHVWVHTHTLTHTLQGGSRLPAEEARFNQSSWPWVKVWWQTVSSCLYSRDFSLTWSVDLTQTVSGHLIKTMSSIISLHISGAKSLFSLPWFWKCE